MELRTSMSGLPTCAARVHVDRLVSALMLATTGLLGLLLSAQMWLAPASPAMPASLIGTTAVMGACALVLSSRVVHGGLAALAIAGLMSVVAVAIFLAPLTATLWTPLTFFGVASAVCTLAFVILSLLGLPELERELAELLGDA